MTFLTQGCTTSKITAEPINILKTCDYPPIIKPSPIISQDIEIIYENNKYIFSEQEFKKLLLWMGDVEIYIKTFNDIVDNLK